MATEAWAAKVAPAPFREFLAYASPTALKVIRPAQVLRRAWEVASHVSTPNERAREAARLSTSIANAGLDQKLRVATEQGAPLDVESLTDPERRLVGQRVLTLYFHQLYWDGPLFLDLRPKHLSWSSERQQLSFYPSSLWCRPDGDFMQRLRSLYEGFYEEQPPKMARGLELYQWECDATPGFSARMERLLREHFGGSSEETRFAIGHFRSTFEAIFREAARSRACLHPDLTFLGVELVGLYLTLESLGVPLDPRAAFAGAR